MKQLEELSEEELDEKLAMLETKVSLLKMKRAELAKIYDWG